MLTPFSLVQSAVALAAREITTPADGGGDQAPAEMAGAAFQFVVELGGRASAALQEGSVVPDDVVAALVVAAIHEVVLAIRATSIAFGGSWRRYTGNTLLLPHTGAW